MNARSLFVPLVSFAAATALAAGPVFAAAPVSASSAAAPAPPSPPPSSGASAVPPPAEDDLTALSLDELLDIEIPTVYAASRYDQKVTRAPASVTIVTREEIDAHAYRNLAEVLESVRGFYISDDRNYEYVGVRGFGRPGDYNSRVLLLVDGHRINDNVYNSAYFGYDFIVDLDLVDHVEVVRGPGSALYGTSAFFAVVNVVTRRASDVKGGTVAASAGSHGAVAGRAGIGWETSNGVGVVLSASRYHSPGQRLFYEEFDDPATQDGIARHSDQERAQTVFGKATWRGFSVTGAFVSRKKAIPTGSYGTVFGDPGSNTLDDRGYLDLGYDGTLSGKIGLSAHLYYDRYYYRGNYLYDNPPLVINRDRTTGAWTGLDDRITFPVGDRHVLTCGTELQINLRQDQMNYDVEPYALSLDSRKRSHLWAAYVQDEATISSEWSLLAGVRYDRYETFGATTNPRLAVLYHPNPRTVFKGLYGTAFRAPNAYELYYGSDTLDQKINPDLGPEKIATSELTYDGWFEGGLRLSASAYRYRIEGLISLETDPADDRLVFRNVESARSSGIESEIEKRWASGISARANAAFQNSKDTDTHQRLSNSPRWLARGSLTAPLAGRRLLASLDLQYTGPRLTIGTGHAAGFTVVNLALSTRALAKGLFASLGAYNVLDRTPTDPGSQEHVQEVIPQDRRTFRLKLSYTF
jgi:iron complex outermembrane receptor protein